MDLTPYADVNELLAALQPAIETTLGDRVLGLYLFGSVVTGDYDASVSDVDLVAVTVSETTLTEFSDLQEMHSEFAAAHPEWDDRIEVLYVPAEALATHRTRRSAITVISPGEPLNVVDAGREWLMNWWLVQEFGVTVHGPSPKTFIPDIPTAEFIEAVRAYGLRWRDYLGNAPARARQSYSVLTLCRAMYTCDRGDHPSKRKAAEWAAARYPEWAPLINDALAWRLAWKDEVADQAATLPAVWAFVEFAIAQLSTVKSDFGNSVPNPGDLLRS